jgi:hypothetical protein
MEIQRMTIKIPVYERIRLHKQICDLLDARDLSWEDLHRLGCGIKPGWLLDEDKQPTLCQIGMMAHKLKIIIEFDCFKIIEESNGSR